MNYKCFGMVRKRSRQLIPWYMVKNKMMDVMYPYLLPLNMAAVVVDTKIRIFQVNLKLHQSHPQWRIKSIIDRLRLGGQGNAYTIHENLDEKENSTN
mmetsp:Transcript_14573/g.20591  ORF Transcript_14573/g.20591 Transcript_14573/m.20591 type:complete len:97 (-) Transcript_14573:129-419(-)